jgi:hypothetical protein
MAKPLLASDIVIATNSTRRIVLDSKNLVSSAAVHRRTAGLWSSSNSPITHFGLVRRLTPSSRAVLIGRIRCSVN